MKKVSIISIAASAIISFSACSNEELAEGMLPEGKYPLEITSVTMKAEVSEQPWTANAPQTRVAENADGMSSHWEWNGNEQIGIQLYENGNTAAYTLNSDKTITPSDKPLYWNNTTPTTVYAAWYPYADGTIDLTHQDTKGLVYVMKGTGSGNYQDGVSLSFTHQLAKIRVKFSKEGTADLTNAKVSVMGYPNCTHSKGIVTVPSGQQHTYLPMRATTYANGEACYEANVVPGLPFSEAPFKIEINGNSFDCPATATTPTAGTITEYTLTIDDKKNLINLSDGNAVNITDNGIYRISGSGTKPITINGSPTIYLENANVTVTDDYTPAINITGGSPTIYVKGMGNSLSSSKYGGIVMSNNANLKITGESRNICKLTVKAGTEASNDNWTSDKSELMSFVGIGAATKCTCGNITIENVQLTVTGGHYSNNRGGAAAIGTSGPAPYSTTQCGEININAAQINATSGAGAAAIGTSYTGGAFKDENTNAYLICGKINIVNSSLSITVKPVTQWNYYGAGIGTGFLDLVSSGYAYTRIAEVVIDCRPLTEEVFTENFKLGGSIGNAGEKIGWGFHNCGSTAETTIECPNHTIGGLYYYYNSGQMGFSSIGYPGTWELRQ